MPACTEASVRKGGRDRGRGQWKERERERERVRQAGGSKQGEAECCTLGRREQSKAEEVGKARGKKRAETQGGMQYVENSVDVLVPKFVVNLC